MRDCHSSAGWVQQGVIQGQLIFPVISQPSNVRKAPPSQPEASTWKPRLPELTHLCPSLCLGRKRRPAKRQGLAQGHKTEVTSPQVSQHPEKGSPHALPNSRMTPMPTAALLSRSPAKPCLGVTSISGFAVQGLGSECQNLKIKRQIVLIGCNYRLKRPCVEKE